MNSQARRDLALVGWIALIGVLIVVSLRLAG